MCWEHTIGRESIEELDEETDEPEFLNEESSVETELVTDGGDEDEE